MLHNITQFIFHTRFFQWICAELGIDWTSAPYSPTFRAAKTSRSATAFYLYTASTRGSAVWTINVKRCEVYRQCFCFGCDGRRMLNDSSCLFVYENAPASLAVSNCWLAALRFVAQFVWMREEYNIVLSTTTDADKFGRFGRYIGKTQILADISVDLYSIVRRGL